MKKTKNDNQRKIATPHLWDCVGSRENREKRRNVCGNWVSGDEGDYVMFSIRRDICSRETIAVLRSAGITIRRDIKGGWKTCKKCYDDFKHELEMYVWYGTNEYNFERLPNPPGFEPTYCAKCKEKSSLSDGGWSIFVACIARCDNCPITEKNGKKKLSVVQK